MIWDTFCKVMERSGLITRFAETLAEVRLFHLPGAAHEILPKNLEDDDVDWFRENFFLPFPIVGIEDKTSLIILIDPAPNSRGLAVPRKWIQFTPMTKETLSSCYDSPEEVEVPMIETHDLATGEMTEVRISYHVQEENKTPFQYNGTVDAHWIIQASGRKGYAAAKTNMAYAWNDPVCRVSLEAHLRNTGAAYQEIMYFNQPNRFVLEECPLKFAQGKGNPKLKLLRRSHQRPIYTLLTPNEIRTRMGLPTIKRGGPRKPHERRQHPRTFRSARFTHMRWKTIIIPATWIGPDQNIKGNKRYKVMLKI